MFINRSDLHRLTWADINIIAGSRISDDAWPTESAATRLERFAREYPESGIEIEDHAEGRGQ